jgi:hypothetical protein
MAKNFPKIDATEQQSKNPTADDHGNQPLRNPRRATTLFDLFGLWF